MENELSGNRYLKAVILEVVDNQLRDNNPPETRQTFDRLIREGHSEKEAKRLIACVVTTEVFDMMKNKEFFNRDRFVKALNRLPELPWEE